MLPDARGPELTGTGQERGLVSPGSKSAFERAPQPRADDSTVHQGQTALLRDLHDGVGGITAGIGMLAMVGQQAATREAKDASLRRIGELALDGSSEIRFLMNALERGGLGWDELCAEMRNLGATEFEQHGIGFTFQVQGDRPDPGPGVWAGTSVLRIYKEAVRNIVRHSRATKASVRVSFAADGTEIRVWDDGSGFAAGAKDGRGLSKMRKRATELGGVLQVDSGPGLCVALRLPRRLVAAEPPRTPLPPPVI